MIKNQKRPFQSLSAEANCPQDYAEMLWWVSPSMRVTVFDKPLEISTWSRWMVKTEKVLSKMSNSACDWSDVILLESSIINRDRRKSPRLKMPSAWVTVFNKPLQMEATFRKVKIRHISSDIAYSEAELSIDTGKKIHDQNWHLQRSQKPRVSLQQSLTLTECVERLLCRYSWNERHIVSPRSKAIPIEDPEVVIDTDKRIFVLLDKSARLKKTGWG